MFDPCSFASVTRCVTKHLNLQLHVDFDRHVIRGKVALTVEALEDRFSVLVGYVTGSGSPGPGGFSPRANGLVGREGCWGFPPRLRCLNGSPVKTTDPLK